MSDETSTSKISITLKGGPGYDAPWIVVKGDSAEEVMNTLKGVGEAGLMLAVRVAASSFQTTVSGSAESAVVAGLGGHVVSDAPAMSGSPVVPGPGAPAGTGVGSYPAPANPFPQEQQLPAGLQPVCPTCNGPTKFMQGSKNGRDWKGYFCVNAPKGGPKHEVVWTK